MLVGCSFSLRKKKNLKRGGFGAKKMEKIEFAGLGVVFTGPKIERTSEKAIFGAKKREKIKCWSGALFPFVKEKSQKGWFRRQKNWKNRICWFGGDSNVFFAFRTARERPPLERVPRGRGAPTVAVSARARVGASTDWVLVSK